MVAEKSKLCGQIWCNEETLAAGRANLRNEAVEKVAPCPVAASRVIAALRVVLNVM